MKFFRVISSTVRRLGRSAAVGALIALTTGWAVSGLAVADDEVQRDEAQHNVTYRARVDGVSRGAVITYRISDAQINSANPTMLPGRTFETTGVLTDPKEAGMRISIQWPYSANLHCEILVDDQMVVQADQFISPRLVPPRDDPDYGAMNCGAPLSNALGSPINTPAPGAATPTDAPGVDVN